jgi:hypothetical protein
MYYTRWSSDFTPHPKTDPRAATASRVHTAKMPTYRSITLSLISQHDFQAIPEYNCPSPPIGTSDLNSKIRGDTKEAHSFADDNTHSVSVYAPTFPNSQFWLSFDAVKPASPTKYYFFKFFVDGTHFNSWGTGEESDWSGKMTFGLFVNEYDQIEKRNLAFGPAADMGGVIEVRVFRCLGRKGITAHLDRLIEDESERQNPTWRENHVAKTQNELASSLKRRSQDTRGIRSASLPPPPAEHAEPG